MNKLVPFQHPEFGRIRIYIDKDGNPWWFAVDVCRVLELSNPSEALRALKDDEKMTLRNPDGHSGQRGGARFFNLINEPGLYRLINKSRTPMAEKFQHWIYHDVLPSIRKTGRYEIGAGLDMAKIETENKRLLATCLTDLAASGLYTPVRAALFKAEAASVLSGKPMTEYLPPVAAERDKWPTPTQLAERFNGAPKRIGMILKAAGLHGSEDEGNRHSEPYWNVTPNSSRQVISYKYDPAVVSPVLRRTAQGGEPQGNA